MADKLPPYRETIAGLLIIAREAVIEPIRPILREMDVTEQQWRVLRVLQSSGAMAPSSLAKAAVLSPPSLARILRDLCQRELLERKIDPYDARRAIVCITPIGQQMIAETSRSTLRVMNQLRQRFGEERYRSLKNELKAFMEVVS